MKYKLSVCVAVYNVEQYIEQCLNSLLCQKFIDAEFIVVDDGSTDKSYDLCQEFSKKDSRFKILKHSNNKGLLAARKTAGQCAKGEYCLFLDGDDYYKDENTLELLYNEITKNKVDVLRFECECIGIDKVKLVKLQKWVDFDVDSRKRKSIDALRLIYEKGRVSWNLAFNIVKTDVFKEALKHCPNEHLVSAEDAFLLFIVISLAKRWVAIHTGPQYVYRIGSGISTSDVTLTNFKHTAKEVRIVTWIRNFLENQSAGREFFEVSETLLKRLLVGASYQLLSLPVEKQGMGFDLMLAEGYIPELICALHEVTPNCSVMGKIAKNFYSSQRIKGIYKEPKVIGLLYHRYFDGGVERVISLQIPMLLELGYKVILITSSINEKIEFYLPPQVKREVIPFSFGIDRARAIQDVIAKNHIDAILYHQLSSWEVFWDLLIIKLSGALFIGELHGPLWYGLLDPKNTEAINFEFARPYIYRLADKLIVLSDAFKPYYDAYGCNVSVLPNPPSFPLDDEELLLSKDREGILWLGRLDNLQKNWRDVLEVFNNLIKLNPEVRCYMGGTEYDKGSIKEVKKFIADNNLENNLYWIGRRNDVKDLLKHTKAFLLLSSFEAFPMSLVEAKICGAPIVMYDLPYLDILKSKKGCIIKQSKDIEGIVNSLLHIISNDEYCDTLILESKESIIEYYRQNNVKTKLHEIISATSANQQDCLNKNDYKMAWELQTEMIKKGLVNINSFPLTRKETGCVISIKNNRFNLFKYKLLSKISFTSTKRARYKQKYSALKQLRKTS